MRARDAGDAATSFATPVDVSLYASATARIAGVRREQRVDLRRIDVARPSPSRARWTTSPYDSASVAHISPNWPLQQTAISSPGENRLQIVASIAPRPVVCTGSTGSRVPNSGRSSSSSVGELGRELRRAMVDHRPRAGGEDALGHARRPRRHRAAAASSLDDSLLPQRVVDLGLERDARLDLGDARAARAPSAHGRDRAPRPACARGTTATPSRSPTTMSPGSTTVPPQLMGTLISPGRPCRSRPD